MRKSQLDYKDNALDDHCFIHPSNTVNVEEYTSSTKPIPRKMHQKQVSDMHDVLQEKESLREVIAQSEGQMKSRLSPSFINIKNSDRILLIVHIGMYQVILT